MVVSSGLVGRDDRVSCPRRCGRTGLPIQRVIPATLIGKNDHAASWEKAHKIGAFTQAVLVKRAEFAAVQR
jgi:hypothetical protein